MIKILPLLPALTLVAACATPGADKAGAPDIYQRSHRQLATAPQAAAACVARNVQRMGYTADSTPLYGREAMAVTAKTLPAGGENIAAVELSPEGAGSRAQITVTTQTLRERPDVIASLLAGC